MVGALLAGVLAAEAWLCGVPEASAPAQHSAVEAWRTEVLQQHSLERASGKYMMTLVAANLSVCESELSQMLWKQQRQQNRLVRLALIGRRHDQACVAKTLRRLAAVSASAICLHCSLELWQSCCCYCSRLGGEVIK